jgi:hypothetical protein
VNADSAALLARYGLNPDGTTRAAARGEATDAELEKLVTVEQELDAFRQVQNSVTRVYRNYHLYVEHDDLRQHVWSWWFGEGRKYARRYIYAGEMAKLGKAVYGQAVKYAEKEKAARSGYRPEDNIAYSKAQIKDLIPLAVDIEAMAETTPVAAEGPKAHGNLAEGGNLLASVVDVRRAIDALGGADQSFLQGCDSREYDWQRIGEAYHIQADSADQRFDRIAGRIAKFLSGETRS